MEQADAISILQTYAQKNKLTIPAYQLVSREGPDHKTNFTVRVTYDTYSADGIANTKKSAKHNAASALIKLLNSQLNYDIQYEESSNDVLIAAPISQTNQISNDDKSLESNDKSLNSQSSTPIINSIGKLQELCDARQIKLPIYQEIVSSTQNSFTMCCKLNDYIETATASTKKKAKQNCADLMIKRLVELKIIHDNVKINNDDNNESLLNIVKLECNDVNKVMSINKAKKLFPDIKKSVGLTVKDRDNIDIANFHSIFRNSFDNTKIQKFHLYYNNLILNESNRTIKYLNNVLDYICYILNVRTIQSTLMTQSKKYAVCYEFNTNPSLKQVGIGDSHEEAQISALNNTIRTIHLFLV